VIVLIAAMSKNGVIGVDNSLPWSIPEDLANFKRLTLGHPIIMGRSTYESIGRPLPKRVNIVLSRTMRTQEGIIVCKDLKEAFAVARQYHDTVFVIGGATVYAQALLFADKLCISWVKKNYVGDTFFPTVDWSSFKEVFSQEYNDFVYKEYERKN